MTALRRVLAIALNTYRETVRDRLLSAFVLFACLLSVLGLLLGSLSVGQDMRILEDIGLFTIALIGGIIAVFAGTNLVYKEIEHKTIYLIFTKPVTGWQFILGKYLGLCLCVLVVVTTMSCFLAVLIFIVPSGQRLESLTGPGLAWLAGMFSAVFFIYLELIFVIAVATFFSTFATPLMSVLFTLCLWLIAHLGGSLKGLGALCPAPLVRNLLSTVYWALPDLESLTRARGYLVANQCVDNELLTFLSCYISAYVILLLCVSSLITERKEFT